MKHKFAIVILSMLCVVLTMQGKTVHNKVLDPIKNMLDSGNYEEAWTSCEALLNNWQYPYAKDTKTTIYYYAGVSLKALGRYTKADDMYSKAIASAIENKDSLIDIYRYSYSNLLMLTGNYQKGLDLLNAIRNPQYNAQRLITLSMLYYLRDEEGDKNRALSYLNNYFENYDIQESNYITALQNKGFIYWDSEELDSAKLYLEEALSLMPSNKANYYITLANLAVVKGDLYDFTEALTDINRALKWQSDSLNTVSSKGVVYHPNYIVSLRKKAKILLKMGNRGEALRIYQTYFAAEKGMLEAEFENKKDNEYRLNYWYSKKPLISEIFQLEDTNPTFLYDVALFRRQMALLRNDVTDIKNETNISVAKLQKAMTVNEVAIEFVCYYDEFAKDTIYAALLTSTTTPTKYIRIATKKDLHQYKLKDGTQLEEGVCSSESNVKSVIYTDSVLAQKLWAPIFSELPKKATKLYFAPDGILQMLGIENLPYIGLKDKEVHRLTSTANLLHRSSDKSYNVNKKRALVIGGVDYDDVSDDYEDDTVEANHIAYNYIKDECGIDVSRGVFSYLQGSKTEADSIILKLPNADDGQDGRSSEGYLKKHMADYGLVHLSTHGYSLKVNIGKLSLSLCDSVMADKTLLASGIALKGANVAGRTAEKEDGLLSARELCDMAGLNGLDLIVLSACQTAQGVVSDEGPTGIVRGLKKAGVLTVMASLWSVNDEATAIFMDAFYNALQQYGCSKYDALRKAQDSVRNYTIKKPTFRFSPKTLSSRPVAGSDDSEEYKPYEEPYYWAAFILIDDL